MSFITLDPAEWRAWSLDAVFEGSIARFRGQLWRVAAGRPYGVWSPNDPPWLVLEGGARCLTVMMGLPAKALSLAQAQAIEEQLRRRPGWRQSHCRDQAPLWVSYQCHPVALYIDERDRRWAALPTLGHAGQPMDVLLAPTLRLDEAQYEDQQKSLFEEATE